MLARANWQLANRSVFLGFCRFREFPRDRESTGPLSMHSLFTAPVIKRGVAPVGEGCPHGRGQRSRSRSSKVPRPISESTQRAKRKPNFPSVAPIFIGQNSTMHLNGVESSYSLICNDSIFFFFHSSGVFRTESQFGLERKSDYFYNYFPRSKI